MKAAEKPTSFFGSIMLGLPADFGQVNFVLKSPKCHSGLRIKNGEILMNLSILEAGPLLRVGRAAEQILSESARAL
jgi:hypothetical protein